jgi:hypothetical protein
VIQGSRRGPPGTNRGSSGTTHSRFFPRSQLRAGFQSMNITPTPGNLLTDVQIVKMFLLFKYRNPFHF